VNRGSWLQSRQRWLAAAIAGYFFLTHPPCSYGQKPPEGLISRQIEALTTGDTSGLLQVREQALQVQLARRWTSIAAGILKNASANVDPDSASRLSKFIYRGALQFVKEGAPVQSAYLPERNLRKFVEAEIEIGQREDLSRPPIRETTFDQAKHSVCPLWPFC
jgi:hypothetical protein